MGRECDFLKISGDGGPRSYIEPCGRAWSTHLPRIKWYCRAGEKPLRGAGREVADPSQGLAAGFPVQGHRGHKKDEVVGHAHRANVR